MDEWYDERLSFTFPMWFDLGHEMCLAVGNTMLKWADNLNSFPPDVTHGEWGDLIRTHGFALRDYGLDIDYADIESREEKAKKALRWISENLETMWD